MFAGASVTCARIEPPLYTTWIYIYFLPRADTNFILYFPSSIAVECNIFVGLDFA